MQSESAESHIVLIDVSYNSLDVLARLLREAEVDGEIETFTIFQDAYAYIQGNNVTVAFVGDGFGFLGQVEFVRALSRLNQCAVIPCVTMNSTDTTLLLKKAGAHAVLELTAHNETDKAAVLRQVLLNALQEFRTPSRSNVMLDQATIDLPQLLERVAKRLELAAHSVTGATDLSSKRIQEQLLQVFASIDKSG